jgi:uncharacterized protein YoxC
MALSLNQLVRERRKVLDELNRKLRTVDSSLELQQRIIKRILARKNKLPEVTDLSQLSTELDVMVKAVAEYNKVLTAGYVE